MAFSIEKHLHGAFWKTVRVVVLGNVKAGNLLQTAMEKALQLADALLVGKMAELTAYPLLERPRVRAGAQHLYIMVALYP